jgi:hypothetical protein
MARQARVRWYRGETAQARRQIADAIALLEREPAGPELADACLEMGKEVWTSRRPGEALGWLWRAMTMAERIGADDIRQRALQIRGCARDEIGDLGGLEDVRESVELGLRLGLGRGTALAYGNLGAELFELALGSEVGHGGWHRASYALFFLLGYLLAADPGMVEAFRRHWRLAAIAGLLAFLSAGAVHLSPALASTRSPPWIPPAWACACSRASPAGCGWWPCWARPAPASTAAAAHRPRHRPAGRGSRAAWPPTATRPCCPSTCSTRRSSS